MSVTVPLEGLRQELERRGNTAYLLTVGDDGRPHCAAVRLGWHGDAIVVDAGRTSVKNAAARHQATLLTPPASARASRARPPATASAPGDSSSDGYSLIVDGDVVALPPSPPDGEQDAGGIRIRPTHAVLHRPAPAPDGAPAHDCLPVYDEVGTKD